ncbi:hypothetical protein [Alkalicaulis satelles]|uniref:hypothetical protein n=1 Tax=Alkalicaulis satelles TaxID=2609175 RepID=UPI001E59C8ED|nr:hypothetical protein [Alkalicaulis satelles]
MLGARGFSASADIDDIRDALELGASALGEALVAAETVAACEARTGRCFFIRRGPDGRADGFIALLYLNDEGYQALMYGRFTPEAPELSHLAARDERALAIYVWCLAGRGVDDKRAVVRAVTEARREAFPDIALFARPVSREGRMMTAALDAPSAGAAWLGWVPASPPELRGS